MKKGERLLQKHVLLVKLIEGLALIEKNSISLYMEEVPNASHTAVTDIERAFGYDLAPCSYLFF